MSIENIRCFIAIQIPDKIQSGISSYINNLRKISSDVRWVKVENIHLTLKFLGEINPNRADLVREILSPMSNNFPPFNLSVSGTGCFPNKKRPRVFWIGMEQGKENPLFSIHQWIENQLVNLDFEKEKRRFSPHLTLGRVRAKHTVDFSDLFRFMDDNPFPSSQFHVQDVVFMQSILKPSGAEYRVLESYPLK
jgi:2'-5' RNA ligase